MTKEPKPPTPDTITVQIIGPNGEVTESLSYQINPTPPVNFDDQSWTEAIAFNEFCAAVQTPANASRLLAAMRAFDRLKCWNAVWTRLSQLDVDDAFRQNFLPRVAEFGYRFRQSVHDLRVPFVTSCRLTLARACIYIVES